MNLDRGSGILLHITSLPSSFGIGDIGPEAYHFVDQLARARQKYWQILPLNPTDLFFHNSPYSSLSAFAVNPLIISPELLVTDGLLSAQAIVSPPFQDSNIVDYAAAQKYKMNLLEKAFHNWQADADENYAAFENEQAFWLDDFALLMVLKEKFDGQLWLAWPAALRDRDPAAIAEKRSQYADAIRFVKFQQYIVNKQWKALKTYCADKDVKIIGDLPIYIEYGGVDVWCSPEYFKLDENKRPYVVAGVPPDYFSKTGQRWGNPIYNWIKLKEHHFSWWIDRLRQNLKLFDIVRIDHFRGLVAYWEVPAEEETAIRGEWVEVPTDEFIIALKKACPNFNVIAEDLGLITDEIKEALERHELPGMKVLQFAFSDDLETNPFLPHNYHANCIVYTGTHDNNTTLGWYRNEAGDIEKWNLGTYFHKEINEHNIVAHFIELALASRANVAIVPAQDLLGLDESGRLNTPGTTCGNWQWRLRKDQLNAEQLSRLAELTLRYDRV
jgi:4-alpha-glucanotransferase